MWPKGDHRDLGSPGSTQSSEPGAPGPYTWSVNGATAATAPSDEVAWSHPGGHRTQVFPVRPRARCRIVPRSPSSARSQDCGGDGSVPSRPPVLILTQARRRPAAWCIATWIAGGWTTPTTAHGPDGARRNPGPSTATAAESGISGNPVTFTARAIVCCRKAPQPGGGLSPHLRAHTGRERVLLGVQQGRTAGRQHDDGSHHSDPRQVGRFQTFIQLATSNFHTCGLTATGTVSCWGRYGGQRLPTHGRWCRCSTGQNYTCGAVHRWDRVLLG